ncbi:DUF6134 family protein [Emcibacter sp. SYSU 3D8]|uniref:DUF6134 family protein n=1 Tax=Emcibacter sp. SYSU 3D8 TaxID=3133969 RepID=UPI0031FEC320
MRRWSFMLVAALAVMIGGGPALAQERVYTYRVVHPLYGAIGTYAKSAALAGETLRLESRLRVAVRILGIVVHREEGDYTVTFRGGRLLAFQATTVVNGKRADVSGEVQGDHFVVTSPAGAVNAPLGVAPSDPWILNKRGTVSVVSMKNGQIIPTQVTGGEAATVSVQGVAVTTRHFTAQGEQLQETWLNDRGVPIIFRSAENGTPIDFILTSPLDDAGRTEPGLVPSLRLTPERER